MNCRMQIEIFTVVFLTHSGVSNVMATSTPHYVPQESTSREVARITLLSVVQAIKYIHAQMQDVIYCGAQWLRAATAK